MNNAFSQPAVIAIGLMAVSLVALIIVYVRSRTNTDAREQALLKWAAALRGGRRVPSGVLDVLGSPSRGALEGAENALFERLTTLEQRAATLEAQRLELERGEGHLKERERRFLAEFDAAANAGANKLMAWLAASERYHDGVEQVWSSRLRAAAEAAWSKCLERQSFEQAHVPATPARSLPASPRGGSSARSVPSTAKAPAPRPGRAASQDNAAQLNAPTGSLNNGDSIENDTAILSRF
jgi:hypothetical protein